MQPEQQHVHHHVHYIPVKPKPVYGGGTIAFLICAGLVILPCLFGGAFMVIGAIVSR